MENFIFKCKENDNQIEVSFEDGKPDELYFRTPDEGAGCGLVYGADDFESFMEQLHKKLDL